jgi:hypothetical protein
MPQFTDAIEFGASPQWDDIIGIIPAPTSAGGTVPTTVNFGVGSSIRALAFAVGDAINGMIQFTHGYYEGTDVEPHIHWSPVNVDTGNVKWSLDYYWININQAASGAPTTITCEQAGGGAPWVQQIIGFIPLVDGNPGGVPKLISSLFMFRLSRVAATAPSYVGAPALLSFDIHYRRNSIGSGQEYIK